MNVLFWCIVIGFSIAQISCIEVPKQYMDEDVLACIEELKPDQSKLLSIFDDNFYITTEDLDMYNLIECSSDKSKLIKDNELDETLTIIEINKTLSVLTKEDSNVAKIIFDQCKNAKGDRVAKRLINFHNCVVDEINKL